MLQSLIKAERSIVPQTPNQWWPKLHWVVLGGLLLRVAVVLISDRIQHGDEIFQYLEQAHRLEFGYGIIPWEYRQGIRSWILPGLLAGLLNLFHRLQLDDPNLYIPAIKIFCCLVSTSLIYSTYIIVRTLHSESAARLTSLITCSWYELIHFASRPTPEVLGAYCLTFAFALVVVKSSRQNTLLFGLFCGLGIMLRFQYLSAIAVLVGCALLKWKKREVAIAASVFLTLVGLTGYVDYLTWGGFFSSFYNNYLYNSVYKISEVFGVDPFTYYFQFLIINSAGLFLIAVINALSPKKFRKTWLILLFAASVVLSHSIIPHKEYRFVFAAIPFLLMLLAIAVADWAGPALHRRAGPPGITARKITLYTSAALVLGISVAGMGVKVRWRDPNYQLQGTVTRREPTLSAYLFLHQQRDLTAILNTYSQWQMTGGYYYLHQNVPIYYAQHFANVIDKANYSAYVSHIICAESDSTPGFVSIAKFGDLEVRRVIQKPASVINPNIDFIHPQQLGIDDNIQPPVQPRFE